MPQPLWMIRQRKGMSVNQLAAKSGVPAISIAEYESGRTIRSADLPRLAKVLFVEEWDIEIQSAPKPKSPAREQTARPAKMQQPAAVQTKTATAPRPPALARPSQIEHLLNLVGRHFDKDRATLEAEIDKPLEQLTRQEASDLLKQHQRLLAEAAAADGSAVTPRHRRAYLPEGVDQFEHQYLTTQQDAGAILHFTLFDGTKTSGRVVGFSPYSITICEQGSGHELTLQKLAIAFYRVAADTMLSEPNSGTGADR